MVLVEEQIRLFETTIAQQESEIRDLEIKVEELHREIDPFTKEYDRIVKPVFDRVEAVRDAIYDFEQIQLKNLTHDGIDAKKLWEAVAEASSLPPNRDAKTESPPKTLKSMSKPKADENLKQLYRRLARRYHPDLAEDEADRAHRNHVMTLINEAYSNRDREALLTLDDVKEGNSDQKLDGGQDQLPLSVLKLRRLQQKSVDLSNRIQDLKIEHQDLMYGEMMDLKIQFKFSQVKGQNILEEIANEFEQEYWKLVKRLDNLRNEVS